MLHVLLHAGTSTSSAGCRAATSGAAVASPGRAAAAGSQALAAADNEQWPQGGVTQGLSPHLPAEAIHGSCHAAEAEKAGIDVEGQLQACSSQAAPASPGRSQHGVDVSGTGTADLSGSKQLMLLEDTAVVPAPGTQAVAGVRSAPGEAQLQELITVKCTSYLQHDVFQKLAPDSALRSACLQQAWSRLPDVAQIGSRLTWGAVQAVRQASWSHRVSLSRCHLPWQPGYRTRLPAV